MSAPPYRKKLIEVALPLKAINEASAREKSIRHGHPSTLHLWWARRPLAACRAMLFASLVDDPDSDPVYRKADGTVDEDRAGLKRAELFNLIEELVQWENSNNPRVINAARTEIARCIASRKMELGELAKDTIIVGAKKGQKHSKGAVSGEGLTAWDVLTMKAKPEVVNAFLAEHAPPVLDPFCGGGSIPLEAQRLGLRAYASDLNPVPVLITRALIEIPPKFAGRPPIHPPDAHEQARSKGAWSGAEGLAEDVRYYGKWMRDEVEKRIGYLYPKVKITDEMAQNRPDLTQYIGQVLPVIAWLWARTVECQNPACRIQVPLMKSFALCTKANRSKRLVPRVSLAERAVTFDVVGGTSVLREGTISRKGAVCPQCATALPYDYIRQEARAGRMGAQLASKVCDGGGRRVHLAVSKYDAETAETARPSWTPDLQLANNPFSLRPALYGLKSYSDLFTKRQLAAMSAFADLIPALRSKLLRAADQDYADAVTVLMAMSVSKLANRCSNACFWDPGGENIQQVFARQAIAMAWDFVEANPVGDTSGGFVGQVNYLAAVVENSPINATVGIVRQHDATVPHPLRSDVPLLSTDPPYYDNIDYADLSDFFYVWLRHMLRDIDRDLFGTVATPKAEELVATPYRFDGDRERANEHFISGTRKVFAQLAGDITREFPSSIVYGFKQQEEVADDEGGNGRVSTGWETFLDSLNEANLAVSGTWPLRTELVGNLKGKMNALASSIVLVCRPRSADSPLATRKDFMSALRRELPVALRNLQHGNIAPVDLAQAAIGPGMAVFTRYAKVIESDGSPMTVRTALGIINQVLDEVLAEQEGDFDADTRWALAWFEQHGTEEGPFGVAETLSKAKNTAVNALVEAGIVKSRGGKVQLLPRGELPDDWDPATDTRLRHWEVVQHLIRTLETKGETEAAKMLNRLGGMGETARELAYRLYSICERKKWSEEALAYNSLVIAWPELSKLALSSRVRQPESQRELF